MAVPTLLSERQIQAQMLASIVAALGINDLNLGSAIDVLTQAPAQETFALYFKLAQISRLRELKNLRGTDLDNIAFEYDLTRYSALKASGSVTVQRPSSFTKVATSFYAGTNAPVIGNTTINVNNAADALYSTAGTLILGRGTNNAEEVAYSIAPVNNTNFWTFTLDSALTANHAVEESVILSQGSDEPIAKGSIVRVPATSTKAEIQFSVSNDYTLLKGEAELANVAVEAVVAGVGGNIPIRAINGSTAFKTPPFTDVRAYNPAKFTNGVNREGDDAFRDRIRSAGDLLTKGVKNAIKAALVGVLDPESAKRVVSASIVLPVGDVGDVKVYIDDGSGFEPSFSSRGYELVRGTATGGEQRLQLDYFPVAKAMIKSSLSEPYDFSGSTKTLIYTVNGVEETVSFEVADFAAAGAATADEVVSIINDAAILIESRTSDNGSNLTLTPKSNTNETFQITGGTAVAILGLTTDVRNTLKLYRDDIELSKDGSTAYLDSQNTAPFNLAAIGGFPQTLTVVVDAKTANVQTATFQSADAANTAAVTGAEVVAVLNRDLAGMVASYVSATSKIRMTSNTANSSSSAMKVNGGTINDVTNGLNFDTTQVVGTNRDYILNRELGIVELTTPLTANQSITTGSLYTRGYLRAGLPQSYAPNNTETLLIKVDGGSAQTITFDASFAAGLSAADSATFINAQLSGATASARTIGSLVYLEITTNSYDGGSIEITGSSTGNAAFGFTLDSVASNRDALKAFALTANTGPYVFVEADNLVVILDNNSTDFTFSPILNYTGAVTTGTSTTVFAASAFATIFTVADELIDYYVAFTSGANTTSETITDAALVSGDSWKYTFSGAPTGFASYAVNDLIRITDMDDAGNNGYFLITAKGAADVTVTNTAGVAATGQTGTGLLSLRRAIGDYVESTGTITVGSAFAATPSIADPFIVIPSTVDNLVAFLNNTKITSLSTKASIQGATNNTKLQITSLENGSDGYVQVTGGSANTALGFATTLTNGVSAYDYWTGLLAVAHKVIYGDDTNLITYPGVGAAGITFRVMAPTVNGVTVQLNVTLAEGISIAALENEIRSAVSGYINSLGVGVDLIVERIRSAVMAVSGVIDVSVSTPAANIATADNELQRVADPDIIIG